MKELHLSQRGTTSPETTKRAWLIFGDQVGKMCFSVLFSAEISGTKECLRRASFSLKASTESVKITL